MNYQVFGSITRSASATGDGPGTWVKQGRIETVTDGSTNTIAVAEKMAVFRKPTGYNGLTGYAYPSTDYAAHIPMFAFERTGLQTTPYVTNGLSPTSPTVAAASTAVANRDTMFQVMPSTTDGAANAADWSRAHAPRPSGILVALVDGSVRLVSPSVTGDTWWAACTPAQGDLPGSDW